MVQDSLAMDNIAVSRTPNVYAMDILSLAAEYKSTLPLDVL